MDESMANELPLSDASQILVEERNYTTARDLSFSTMPLYQISSWRSTSKQETMGWLNSVSRKHGQENNCTERLETSRKRRRPSPPSKMKHPSRSIMLALNRDAILICLSIILCSSRWHPTTHGFIPSLFGLSKRQQAFGNHHLYKAEVFDDRGYYASDGTNNNATAVLAPPSFSTPTTTPYKTATSLRPLSADDSSFTTTEEIPLASHNPRQSSHASKQKYNLTLLLIDHYDSFTYNLYDMLAQHCEHPPIVLAKDAYADWSDVVADYGQDKIDGVILSPGPGTPTNPQDIGTLSPSILQQNPALPILGVCLGHQIMGYVYGATVDLCGPVHGQVRRIQQSQPTREENDTLEEDPLWKSIPNQIGVTRYHSLAVRLPKDIDNNKHNIPLRPTAFSVEEEQERILMGMSHAQYPHYGVQFHPESIGSEFGKQLLENFCDICQQHKNKKENNNHQLLVHDDATTTTPTRQGDESYTNGAVNGAPEVDLNTKVSGISTPATSVNGVTSSDKTHKYRVMVHKVQLPPGSHQLTPLEVFEEFLSEKPFSVWLDTSRGIQSASSSNVDAEKEAPKTALRYSSILGAGDDAPIEYFGKEYNVDQQGLYRWNRDGTSKTKVSSSSAAGDDDILTFLRNEHANATDSITMVSFDGDNNNAVTKDVDDDCDGLPFEFRGGHVGYLGYEVRFDSQRFLEEQEHGAGKDTSSFSRPPSSCNNGQVPTAAFLFLDKSWVYDHSSEEWYLIGVVENDKANADHFHTNVEAATEWMQSTAARMKTISEKQHQHCFDGSGKNSVSNSHAKSNLRFTPNRSRDTYNSNFADCQEQIRLGESYELCLTNQLEADVTMPRGSSSPLDLYKILRQRNPAPFSAFLNWNTGRSPTSGQDKALSSLAICCSSPERFVSVKRKKISNGVEDDEASNSQLWLQVEAKPIKGTCARVIPQDKAAGLSAAEAAEDQRRARELQDSIKNRAENLMIVDLLRNDLSRVCEIGSVHVSSLMNIESYATVHQMVSTIRGSLDPSKANAIDVLQATFPGGSMTGAPKIRTMEILDRLEEGVGRGPYSGCLGYISLNGAMDMNIVIRTALLKPKPTTTADEQKDEWRVGVGAGGAITALSESTDEYEEMLLKASAVMQAVEEWAAAAGNDGAATAPWSALDAATTAPPETSNNCPVVEDA